MSTVADDKKSTFGKSFSKASQMIGVGTPLHKQLKFAILEGNEEKAISIYNLKEMGKPLKSTLHPSKPFPSKKDPNGETPLHLSAKQALPILFSLFLEFGGRPDILNSRKESCAHTVCSEPTNDAKRAEIVDNVLKWRSVNPSTNRAVSVDINGTDIDGNTALHLAACHGLLQCIEKLIAHRAHVFVLNNSNLTCAEFADISGRASVGTAIELASLFAPPAESGRLSRDTARYYNILNIYKNNGMGVLVLDSHSLTASSLLKFISRTVAMVSEALQETPARTEIMLMHYNWDVRRLIEDYRRDARAITAAVRIQPRDGKKDSSQALVVHSEAESSVVLHDSELRAPFGVPISEVYLDPSYRDVGPFSVVRGGKKASYSIRQVKGKTVVVPFDVDPAVRAHTLDDQHVSANSHLKPQATSVCSMCGEQMMEACSVQHYLADTLVQPKHRELQCGSGHKFCFSCWSGFLRAHASGQDGLHGLQCPGVNCGEMLDLQWAPVLLNSPDLVNRVMTQRLQLVAEKLRLHWCTIPNCGLIVHVHAAEGEEARGSDCKAGNIPLCGLCANGHGVCVCCGNEPHAPCQCAELAQWHELVREVSRTSQSKDQSGAGHMLLHAPTHKNCRQCGASNGKEDGSNHIRCSACHRDFCWVCLQDWELHLVEASAETEPNGHTPFQCNNFMELHVPLPHGLSERHAVFLQYFARYQAHMESFALETAAFRSVQDRVLHGLKAAHNGDLLWLLGDTVHNPYNPEESTSASSNDREMTLSTAYLHREKCLEFLAEAFEELLRCRTLLRWAYPFIMFRFEREFQQSFAQNGMMLRPDRSDQQLELMTEQHSLEVCTERLSDLIAHKRLRGSKTDIVEATLSAKGQRIQLETHIVQRNSGFGAASLEYTRSASIDRSSAAVPEARVGGAMKRMIAVVEVEGPTVSSTAAPPKAQSMQPPVLTSGTGTQSASSVQQVVPVDSRPAPTMPPLPPPPPVYAAADSDSEYGYNSGDDEGLQVCTDVSAIKIGDSPRLAGDKTVTTTQKLSLDTLRTSQQAEETTTTVKTTRLMAVSSNNNTRHSNNNINSHSGNSLMSDLTTGDANHSSSALPTPTYARIPRMPLEGPTSPLSPAQQSVAASTGNNSRFAAASKASSISSKHLTKKASRVWQKQTVEHLDEHEVKIVYSLMSKHKITRDKAVRMFLEEHDERLYNPKAVYLFPGEEYHPEEEDDDSEEERRKQEMFGRVEYNHKVKTDSDTASVSEVSPTTIEQRLIGAKKDPDQEALEHALLLSAQEQEFGINMYDSLTPADELVLAEYRSQGFTREEGALIIYEEKFGKTQNSQYSRVIPAMPTLQAVHHYGGSHSQSHQSEYYSDDEDDEEIADLIGRGYTREQAIAVIEAHKEKARQAAASQHPTDPTHYYPHPDEERFNLSEKEEREVELVMSRQGCSRRIAVECVVEMRTTTTNTARLEESYTSSEYYSESAEVRSYMDRGYSREQALQLIRNKSNAVSSTSSVGSGSNARRPSFSSQTSFDYDSSVGAEDSEVVKYMNRGYTREQAWEIVRRAQSSEASARRASGVAADTASVYSGSSTIHTRTSGGHGMLPPNMDGETAELVREQNEDYGTNMFADITPDDDEEVERLMADGYTYNEALLEIFNYSHPPRPAGRPYTSYPPPQPAMAQSFYQSGALPPQYPVAPSQSFYMQQPGYMPAQPYYPPPQPQPVMHTQSFYQQQPGAMPMYAPTQPGGPYGQQVMLPSPEEDNYSNNKPARKASSRTGKPPVLNGSQTLLEQKRQDAAKAARERERESEVEKKPLRKNSSLMNVFGGATRRKADNEDDLMMRATHMSDVDRGRKEANDKQRVPKLKYNEGNVQKLVKMGFSKDQAVQALVESRDDVDEAARMLVDTC